MSARNYEPNFMLKLMAKDLRYAIDEAKVAASFDLTTAETAAGGTSARRFHARNGREKDLLRRLSNFTADSRNFQLFLAFERPLAGEFAGAAN